MNIVEVWTDSEGVGSVFNGIFLMGYSDILLKTMKK